MVRAISGPNNISSQNFIRCMDIKNPTKDSPSLKVVRICSFACSFFIEPSGLRFEHKVGNFSASFEYLPHNSSLNPIFAVEFPSYKKGQSDKDYPLRKQYNPADSQPVH